MLLNIFQSIYSADLLVPIITEILDGIGTRTLEIGLVATRVPPLNAVISSLEVLMVLLKDTNSYCQRRRCIEKCVMRICALAAEHFDNQMITMPVIGTMLTLRDKNLGLTMDSLAKLDPPVLAKFEALAKRHAPDLSENIKHHV